MNLAVGRRLYGVSAIILGLAAVVTHNTNPWEQLDAVRGAQARGVIMVGVGLAQIAAGVVIQSKWTQSASVVLSVVYALFAFMWLPHIMHAPAVYENWANCFIQVSIFSGGWMLFALTLTSPSGLEKAMSVGRALYGTSLVSFAIEQAVDLQATAQQVPSWIPPGQMFWAVTTTFCFALAAFAILSGLQTVLAARLTAIMIVGFELTISIPEIVRQPFNSLHWIGNAENIAIGASAWILAETLGRKFGGSIP